MIYARTSTLSINISHSQQTFTFTSKIQALDYNSWTGGKYLDLLPNMKSKIDIANKHKLEGCIPTVLWTGNSLLYLLDARHLN
jgi:hypothetical protein